jgi:hypothetical protein
MLAIAISSLFQASKYLEMPAANAPARMHRLYSKADAARRVCKSERGRYGACAKEGVARRSTRAPRDSSIHTLKESEMNGSIKRLLAGVVIATCSAGALAQAGGTGGGAGGGSAGVGAGGGTAGGAAGINTARPPSGSGYNSQDSGYGSPGTTATGGGMGTGTGAAPAPVPRQTMPSGDDNSGMNNAPMQPNGGMRGSQ